MSQIENKAETRTKMGNPTWIKNGTSPNPGGRPKLEATFRAKARRIVDELVLAAWENEILSMGDNWFRASELLAAYGYGRPNQSIEVTAEVSTCDESQPLTNEERRQYLKALLAEERSANDAAISRGEAPIFSQ